ncbi:Short-chain dehydrogenase [Talaromyces pinophilus]|nr:Short-chain dehydrogenase [Talaromyces pinophilus]
MPSFTFESTADEAAKALGSEIEGKNIIITGTSLKSLGLEAAKAIATKRPAVLVLTARKLPLLEQARSEILAQNPETKIKLLAFDFGSQHAVREAVSTLSAYEGNFDVILNAAGVMAAPFALTGDGIESHFAINHIGPFLFTNLLLPKLNKGARIINVSSRAYQLGPILWDDISFENTPYNKWQAYAQSKAANILFSAALARKLSSRGIVSFSIHPGTIWTNIGRHLTQEDLDMLSGIPREYKNAQQGAAGMLVAAFDPSIADQNGGYLDEDNQIKPIPEEYDYAFGPGNEERLWKLSERLVNDEFSY